MAKQLPNYYAAVVVISNDGKVLLGKRKEDGIWTTPSGGADIGEENPTKTAVRELFEETGIPVSSQFLQPLKIVETNSGKLCHVFLYVCGTNVVTTSKLDPDEEISGKWKWFSISEIPNTLRNDSNRFESVLNGYMKFYGIQKSLFESLEKGGKPAAVGEIRSFGGRQYQKLGDGTWKPYVHPEEKQLNELQNKNKVVSLTDKLKNKVKEKNAISQPQQHLQDLKHQTVIEGQETRSGKPMFLKVDNAMAHGYKAEDFREAANFFYDRGQAMAENIFKLKEAKQKIDPAFEEIRNINIKIGKDYLKQANRVDDLQSKSKGKVMVKSEDGQEGQGPSDAQRHSRCVYSMKQRDVNGGAANVICDHSLEKTKCPKCNVKKSVVLMGYADAAEVDTSKFALEQKLSEESGLLNEFQLAMEGYQYGELPRRVMLDKGDLYLVKVDDGLYSGIFKLFTNTEDGILEDNAKVRLERMSLPSLVQFCLAKEWTSPHKQEVPVLQSPTVEPLIEKLSIPEVKPVEDRTIRILELISKLIS